MFFPVFNRLKRTDELLICSRLSGKVGDFFGTKEPNDHSLGMK